jgi:hypothetical protein
MPEYPLFHKGCGASCGVPDISRKPLAQADSPTDSPLPATLLEDAFFAPLRDVIANNPITRECPTFDDDTFAILSVLRVLQSSKSGRDFLQIHGIPNAPGLTCANYFANLSSKRRLDFMRKLDAGLRAARLPGLRAHHDLLAAFPELDGWEVWAADGHKIAHATHDQRNDKEQYTPVGAIYKLDLRTGWAGFIALIQPTARGTEHELTTLKRQPSEDLRCGAAKGRRTLLAYDSAIIDFKCAHNLKQGKGIYILTRWKDNLAPMTCIGRPIDRTHPANALITGDETVYFESSPTPWRRITAKSADSGEIHIILTNEMNLAPGVLSECYRLRWLIEKAFDQQEQKLDERKAWANSDTAKSIQALAICIARNLLQLFKATIRDEEGIEDTKVITAYHKNLAKREASARKAGRTFPKALYLALYRPTELSLQFIRWLRSHIFRAACYRQALDALRPLMLAYL